jgi:hypothetical protein
VTVIDEHARLSPEQTLLEIAGHTQAHMADVRTLHEQLYGAISRLLEPADLHTVVLTPTEPTKGDRGAVDTPSLSIGFLNPNNIAIAAGLSGGSATAAARAVTVPPNSLLVLPIAVAQLELGARPADLGADNAVVFVLRFKQVQPAYLGKGA